MRGGTEVALAVGAAASGAAAAWWLLRRRALRLAAELAACQVRRERAGWGAGIGRGAGGEAEREEGRRGAERRLCGGRRPAVPRGGAERPRTRARGRGCAREAVAWERRRRGRGERTASGPLCLARARSFVGAYAGSVLCPFRAQDALDRMAEFRREERAGRTRAEVRRGKGERGRGGRSGDVPRVSPHGQRPLLGRGLQFRVSSPLRRCAGIYVPICRGKWEEGAFFTRFFPVFALFSLFFHSFFLVRVSLRLRSRLVLRPASISPVLFLRFRSLRRWSFARCCCRVRTSRRAAGLARLPRGLLPAALRWPRRRRRRRLVCLLPRRLYSRLRFRCVRSVACDRCFRRRTARLASPAWCRPPARA